MWKKIWETICNFTFKLFYNAKKYVKAEDKALTYITLEWKTYEQTMIAREKFIVIDKLHDLGTNLESLGFNGKLKPWYVKIQDAYEHELAIQNNI